MSRNRYIFWVTSLVLLSRIGLEWVGLKAASESWIPKEPNLPAPVGFWEIWGRFDSILYMKIVEGGYYKQFLGPAGWFPGYPALVKVLSVFGPPLPMAVVLSTASLVGSLILFRNLAELDSDTNPLGAAVLLLSFPTAFLLSSVYSESLFLFWVCGAFFCARTGRWGWAVALATAASLTRLPGLILVPVLAWELYLREGKFSRRVWLLVVPPLGVAGFFFHLHFAVGNFWEYFQVQGVLSDVLGVWKGVSTGHVVSIEHQLGMAFLAFEILLLALCWRDMRGPYRLFVSLSILVATYHTQGLCSHRFMLVLFPLFFGLERKLSRVTLCLVCALFLVAQIILWTYWVQGYRSTY